MNPKKPTKPLKQPSPQSKPSKAVMTPEELESVTPTVALPTIVDHPDSPNVPANEKKSRGTGKKLVYVLLVIIMAGIGYYGYQKLTDKPDAANSAVSAKKDIPVITYAARDVTGDEFFPKFGVSDPQFSVEQQIFEGLVKYSDTTKIVPNLASSWTNPSTSTWDFELTKNVKFHTGRTMTAADVVYSFDQAKTNDDLWGTFGAGIKEVKAINDHRVEITTEQPDPFLLNKLTNLFVIDSKSTKANDPVNGTGPYQLKDGTTPSAGKLELVAFDGYHGGHVSTRALTFLSMQDDESVTKALQDGSANLGGELASKLDSLQPGSYNEIDVADSGVTMLVPNAIASGSLKKLQVRQALQLALDQKQIVARSGIVAQPSSQMMIQAIPGYDASIGFHARDVVKAKQLLAQAGYPNGLTLSLSYANTSYDKSVAEITAELKEVGITIKATKLATFGDLLQSFLKGKDELTLLTYSSDVLDGSDVFSTVLQQSGNYNNAQLNKNLDDAAATLDQAKRLQYLQQTAKLVDDDAAAIPLFNRTRIWYAQKGLVIPLDMPGSGTGAFFWKAYQE
jgi:peptide/nickel transport system substrate-binding protein